MRAPHSRLPNRHSPTRATGNTARPLRKTEPPIQPRHLPGRRRPSTSECACSFDKIIEEGGEGTDAAFIRKADEGAFSKALSRYFAELDRLPEGALIDQFALDPGISSDLTGWLIKPDGTTEKIDLNRPDNGLLRINPERVSPYYIGVVIEELPEILREHLGLPEGTGLLVGQVFKNSPATKHEIRAKDVITKVGGEPLKSQSELVEAIQQAGKDNAEVTIELVSRGKTHQLSIKPARREAPKITSKPFVPDFGHDRYGDSLKRWIEQAQGQPVRQQDLAEIKEQIRANHELLKKILERLETSEE